jgi:hypothetical protein
MLGYIGGYRNRGIRSEENLEFLLFCFVLGSKMRRQVLI